MTQPLEEALEQTEQIEREPQDGKAASLYEWMEAAIFSLIAVVLVFSFLFRVVGVDGTSMLTTLQDRDRLIISSLPYTPRQGDIVVINRVDQGLEPLVKRVIAVEGQTVQIVEETGDVLVDGQILNEPYLYTETVEGISDTVSPDGLVTVPKGYVFVMGDNRARNASLDSRFIGCIQVEDIIGKAVFRLWPFDSFGGLYSYFE